MSIKIPEQSPIDIQSLNLKPTIKNEQSLARFISFEITPQEDIDSSDSKAVSTNETKMQLKKTRCQKEVASRLDISPEMLKKKLYHKPISRDWVIAICAAYGLDAYQTGEALTICEQPSIDEEIYRDNIIKAFLNTHKDNPASISSMNSALAAGNCPELEIQKRRRYEETKEEATPSPYSIVGQIEITVSDYEENYYNSLSTKYEPNQECQAKMILQDADANPYLLTAFSNGEYTLRTLDDPLPQDISLETDPGFSPYMLQLMEVVRKRKQECDDILNDSRNYPGRFSANIMKDAIHVFYEEFNYEKPERREFLLMEYCNGQYRLSVAQSSMFMQEYLSAEDYYIHYHSRKRIERTTYHSIDEIESLLANENDRLKRALLRHRRHSFNRLQLIVENKLAAIRNDQVRVNDIDYIWDNPWDVLHYYNIEEHFKCEYDPEFGEIIKCLDSVEIPNPDGTMLTISFDEVVLAFKLGFTSFEQIRRVKLKSGSIASVLK